jgi:recombination protein RecT
VSESVTGAVAKRESGPGAMIQQYSADFITVLPSHINGPTWVRLAQGLLRRDPKLAEIALRNPGSLMQALLECARLGHEPGTDEFHLVPIKNEIEGWEGYTGIIERMYRAGAVLSVKPQLVKANDVFRWNPNTMTRPDHEIDWFGDRGEVLGAYAYAEMQGGVTSHVVVADQDMIARARARSANSNHPKSPWVTDYGAMVLKTALKRLEKFVPTSSEYIREKLRVARDIAAETPPAPARPRPSATSEERPPVDVSNLSEMRDDDPDLLDAEIVDDIKNGGDG